MPVASFTFRARGRSEGKTLDALVFVNGRWVLMPKPHMVLAAMQREKGKTPQSAASNDNVTPTPPVAAQSINNHAQHAVDFVLPFLAPDADRIALTARLRPTADDVRTLYKEPLASRLIAIYDEKWRSDTAFGPNPGQDEVLVDVTTSDRVIDGDTAARAIWRAGSGMSSRISNAAWLLAASNS